MKHYPRMWRQYVKGLPRKVRKAGATHIVWVAAPSLRDTLVGSVEGDLIESLCPSANLNRPRTPASLQGVTRDVFARMRSLVHANRESRYALLGQPNHRLQLAPLARRR